MKIDFIDLKTQYKQYQNEIDQAVLSVMASAQFIGGPEVSSLEKELAQYSGSAHAIGCSSGTDALLLALMAIDVKPGDEVITTPFTFIATAEVIAFLGAIPVFVDIDEKTYNIDPTKIEEKITSKTKAIIPVSLYGQPADMDEINKIAQRYGLIVIEDGAQSFGAEYKGKKSCNLSHIGCTSFFPSKPLGCYGDGGAVFTNDERIAKKIDILKNHGQTKRYEHELIGLNARLDAIQAAILRIKLKHFPQEIEDRITIATRYTKALQEYVVTPLVKADRTSVYAQYSIQVQNRDEVCKKLNEKGIPTAIHYPKPLHLQKAFSNLGYKLGDFPVAEKVSQHIMSLPMSPFLQKEQQDYIIDSLIEIVKEAR
ncbi:MULTISPECIES: DegT/DnrJ/EryC1/StrS aminotransferase family protein [unclassified Nitratiruptor]|uniref:DegT/DnrJ/EryC1/StrS family aminotransferase n=1 Tax=unclassified Nitratiruptor TaxID=2624044 RepID=UPI001915D76E|nr:MULTISPECIES: DegT/DnrJ/EryC1/StrS family aminotransferase [unclassified Nitratiruptor]BCD60631.1 UDP-2-acetamido-2-deoxy-ribo-hexuluronate aminotransferase [Nitratiruptor sp. YY08-10]BCD64562.1 UDP-2-acetamido-2-deoxy-ribo-hexuluronate aminotransferase [Nitratiruptor sp. YY08-14]